MADPTAKDIWRDGLWRNNAGLVQLLGLCPLLAVSNSVVTALGLGLATLLTVTISNAGVSLLRRWLVREIRIPIYVLVIASTVTGIELLINAWWHELYLRLGIFLPLIVTNCAIIGRAEAFASRHRLSASLIDGLATGAGFALVLLVLGAGRELIGRGTLLANAQVLFGEMGANWTLEVVDSGFLLALLPPGAFIGLGLMVAAYNHMEGLRQARAHRGRAVNLPARSHP